MSTIYDALSVDPNQVTDEQIAAVFAEHNITPGRTGFLSFFEPGKFYRRSADLFRCAAVGTQRSGNPIALGFMPIDLAGQRKWEVMFKISIDWADGWAVCHRPKDGER